MNCDFVCEHLEGFFPFHNMNLEDIYTDLFRKAMWRDLPGTDRMKPVDT
jgi:hypothetical protein